MSQLTKEIDAFDQKLRAVDGTKRSSPDHAVTQLSFFVLQLSRRIDKIIDEDAEM